MTSHSSIGDLVFPGENGRRFLSPTVVLRRHLYPAMAAAEIRRVGTDAGEADIPQLQAHVRKAGPRERRSGHLALTASWPLLTQGDDGHLRPLGARRAQAPSREDGGRLSGLTSSRTEPVLAVGNERQHRRRRKCRRCRDFLDGPGWDRTSDLGIKSPLLYRLSYRPAPVSVEAARRSVSRLHAGPHRLAA